jgi:AbrB family looped-hinge helix DNA binding protein
MGMHEQITTVISSKGQIILPKSTCEERHWLPGTRLIVEDTAGGVLLKAAPAFAATTIDSVFGSLPHKGFGLSVDDMDVAIAGEAKRRARD